MLTVTQHQISMNRPLSQKQPVFCGNICGAGAKKLKKVSLYNPFSETFSRGEIDFDSKSSKIFALKNSRSDRYLTVKYNPRLRGNLISKTTGEKIPVIILETREKDKPDQVAYHFMSRDLYREYGFVQLYRPNMKEVNLTNDLYKNYPDKGIIGDRLVVVYLKNETHGKLKGVGKLADKMAVKYCLDNNIAPNIISYAKINSEIAHYKRGKRFIAPEKDSLEYKALVARYNTADMDKIIEKLLKKEKDENIFIQGFYYPLMYMPKEVFEKYKKEITSKKCSQLANRQ